MLLVLLPLHYSTLIIYVLLYFSHDAVIATAYPFLKECQNTLKQVRSAQVMAQPNHSYITFESHATFNMIVQNVLDVI